MAKVLQVLHLSIDVALEQARLSFMCNYTLQVQPLWRNLLKAICNFIINHMRFHSVLARLRLGKNKIHFLVISIFLILKTIDNVKKDS